MAYRKNKPSIHPTIKIGDVVGKWEVIDNTIIRNSYGNNFLLVRCISCKNTERTIAISKLLSKKINACKNCTVTKTNHYKWKGVGNMSQSVLKNLQNNSRKKDREVSVSLEYLWDLYIKQNKKCALTGIFLGDYVSHYRINGELPLASVDRIDSSKGYIEGNVQWVHKDINALKSDFPLDRFLELCKLVADYNKNEN
jgi:hypothetical protein